MLPLHPQLRNQLERTVIAARAVAERGAGDALRALGVEAERAPDHLDEEARARRVKLRAELKRLGSFADLRAEVAYETWHKMLFARFLLRNDLLRYQGFAVAPDDLNDAEVQAEFGARTPDELEVALATAMLPGLFDGRDPAWKFELPAETRGDLLKLLGELPPETFAADDALGWVYQYWQTARKADVNAAGGRVEARDVPAVTQLFTEPYMVEWLLDQTLGKLDDAALSRVSLLDPCCGSGHFLVAAFARVFEARQRVEGETTLRPRARSWSRTWPGWNWMRAACNWRVSRCCFRPGNAAASMARCGLAWRVAGWRRREGSASGRAGPGAMATCRTRCGNCFICSKRRRFMGL